MNYIAVLIALATLPVFADVNQVFKNIALKSDLLIVDEHTEFQFLGSLNNGNKIFNYRRYFNAGLRAATRLVVIDTQHNLVGMYAVNDWATHVDEECVYFAYPASEGNSICLESDQLPTQAWVDGSLPSLYR